MTVEIQGPDSEWTEVPGVASVDIELARDAAQAAAAEYARQWRDFLKAARPVLVAVAERYARLGRALRQAALVDEEGKPARRPGRPAWQSPYGPPTRRRR